MHLTTAQRDRAVGAIIGMACGDALGAPYEFQPARINGEPVVMDGGGAWGAGEWTDDTTMALGILQAAANGADFAEESTQNHIVAWWQHWAQSGPKDIGIQTSSVLRSAEGYGSSAAVRRAAYAYLDVNPRAAGNGSLMRTAPVVLACLDDEDKLWRMAMEISALTHADITCQEACAIWCLAIRQAVLTGDYGNLRDHLTRLNPERQTYWLARIDEAEANPPHHFEHQSGWVVAALQAAWSAIYHTAVPELDPAAGSFPCQHAEHSIEAAVRTGFDTDTVAAIAGMLVGARWGVSGLPIQWQLKLHGYPGWTGWDLVRLASEATQQLSGSGDVSTPAQMPMQPYWTTDSSMELGEAALGLVIGGQQLLRDGGFDAAVSLCRVGTAETDLPANQHARIWVMDSEQPEDNRNLEYMFAQVADIVDSWLADGKRVLLHCVQAQNRTPAFATAFLMLKRGLDYRSSTELIRGGLATANPHGHLDAVVRSLGASQR